MIKHTIFVRRFTSATAQWYAKSKKVDSEPQKLLGRLSGNLKGGVVGLANVGKSTFFQAITESNLGSAQNFPFCTIDPEEAKVVVPSDRFNKLCEVYKPKIKTPATLTIFDIAGLVRGASENKGMGNEFLSHIRAVDGLFQVVRAFDDPEIIHIEESVDPVRDLQIIHDELLLKDMEFALKFQELCERQLKRSPGAKAKQLTQDLEMSKKVLAHLEEGKRVIDGSWSNDEVDCINRMALLTAKPSVYLVNVSEDDYMTGSENERLGQIRQWVQDTAPGHVVPMSVVMEHRLSTMDRKDKQEELEILELQSALPEAIKKLRSSLQLIDFFTCGEKEVRSWTARQGTKAPEAAGLIHNDFQKTFIQAQVSKFDDIVQYNGDESSLKANGKIQAKGKDYVVEDGDIITFKAGAAKR